MGIKIYSVPGVHNHAKALCKTINNFGFNCQVVQSINSKDNDIYIIYAAHRLKSFPKNYIVYQIEQFGSAWFTYQYYDAMKKALSVWEFSQANINRHVDVVPIYVPPGIIEVQHQKKEIDVLFYGWMNEHRKAIVYDLGRTHNITIITNKFADEVLKFISASKVVLNIHFYKNASLEVFRINEALSCEANVVSEKTNTGFYPKQYETLIEYGTSINELSEKIKSALLKPPPPNISSLDNAAYVFSALKKL